MTHAKSFTPRRVSRRAFLELAAAAGLLAGCRQAQPVVVTATPAPPPTPAPAPTPVLAAPGVVVQARHSSVWAGESLVPAVLDQMLDAAVAQLAGTGDAAAAWAALFDPGERIAIKVNTIIGSNYWTRVELVDAITHRLQMAGVPPEQIVVYDRHARELEAAGFTINRDGPGVRCYGTDGDYTPGWTLLGRDIQLSDILLNSDALINLPIVKGHSLSSLSFALKNHYGTFNCPRLYHQDLTTALAELNALLPIVERTRLVVGDALALAQVSWRTAWPGDSLLVSYDPVAADAVALQMFRQAMEEHGAYYEGFGARAYEWLRNSTELGVGVGDIEDVTWMRLNLG